MIINFLKKVPAGMMIVPMFISAIINTFFPEILQIGSFTTAVFTSQGMAAILGVQLICMGAQLRVDELFKVLKRGGVLLLSKFFIGAILGIGVGYIFGPLGIFGLSSMAIICAVTNSNGSMYLALMTEYGDEVDQTSMSLLAINDGPFFTLLALGLSGLANIPIMALVAVIVPILFGMLIGNIDKKMQEFLEPGVGLLLPFVGITLGAGMNIKNILGGGASGLILGLVTVFIGGAFIVLCDRKINKRPGYAGWAVASTAGNAIAVPAMVGAADPTLMPIVEVATTQVAASAVLSAILVPILTAWWVKKHGAPKAPLEGQSFK
ncbi:2-keto-3-deoxygluconate permease [Peptoniphilus sp. MSJ-1]|uniref:2-keto-3-deoxygluconate permease n=1 Tax=Peptoniphilus ovalis TaxID=2841503 RepID=A0ABS6FDH4_9FIRM|nr:2-keto-3-deoxygluconate permease [Peptoniphilus ovalis]MBU5668230.1 2-keto-3-deoxygluconate permease [Peptoniphilus ovalis]